MIKQYSRKEILSRLRGKIEKKEPIIIGGSGIGLIAKIADRAGIDLLMVYNTGPFRMDGHGSLIGYLAYSNANDMTLELAQHVLKVVKNTPVLAGIGAADPYRDVDRMIDQWMDLGLSGITNVPTAGLYNGKFRENIDETEMGYPLEVELIANCRKRDIFSIAYVFTPEESRAMAAAGADIIGAHVGLTVGGMIGAKTAVDLDKGCEMAQAMIEAAKKENPDVLVIAHGGPFEDVASTKYCFEHTDSIGYLGASSLERLPVERAITAEIKAFQELRLK